MPPRGEVNSPLRELLAFRMALLGTVEKDATGGPGVNARFNQRNGKEIFRDYALDTNPHAKTPRHKEIHRF